MPLETATFISDLNVSNPAHSDPLSQADAHMRMIKAALKSTFAHTGPLTNSDNQLIPADGSSTKPAYSFASEPTLGFYRSAAGTLAYTGTLLGAKAIGEIFDFAGTTAPAGSLACDGQAVSRTTYASLFAAIGTTWGAGDGSTTFNLPNLTSRFRRHRDTSTGLAGLVGNTQAPVIQAHAHAVTGNTGNISNDHTHSFSGTTGSMNQNASHSHSSNAAANIGGSSTPGGSFAINPQAAATISATNTDHQHAFSGTTSGVSSNHTHPINLTSGVTGDANETRPYSATVLTCIRVQ